jgi:hypothetical protein
MPTLQQEACQLSVTPKNRQKPGIRGGPKSARSSMAALDL